MSQENQFHFEYIRHSYALARAAAAAGNHPFGALLVSEGEIILEAQNTVHQERDVTCHAEMNLVRMAVRKFSPKLLSRAALYTSTEPCPMCAGAIYWSGIGAVVYGCSAARLATAAGGGLPIPCREIFSRGERTITVHGPVLEELGAAIHESFWPQ